MPRLRPEHCQAGFNCPVPLSPPSQFSDLWDIPLRCSQPLSAGGLLLSLALLRVLRHTSQKALASFRTGIGRRGGCASRSASKASWPLLEAMPGASLRGIGGVSVGQLRWGTLARDVLAALLNPELSRCWENGNLRVILWLTTSKSLAGWWVIKKHVIPHKQVRRAAVQPPKVWQGVFPKHRASMSSMKWGILAGCFSRASTGRLKGLDLFCLLPSLFTVFGLESESR